jgi:hypothetical protein
MVSEAAVLQMSKSLNLTIVLAVGCILVGCAGTICGAETLGCCRSRELAPWPHVQCPHDRLHADRKRRTPKRARQIFIRPSCHERRLRLSRFPLGTRFRIVDTKEEFIIDDYGTALIGTSTIDLYKPTKLEMKRWGVRNVDIDILQWGSEKRSLKGLGPRAKHQTPRRMIAALQKRNVVRASKVASSSKQAAARTSSSRTLD